MITSSTTTAAPGPHELGHRLRLAALAAVTALIAVSGVAAGLLGHAA